MSMKTKPTTGLTDHGWRLMRGLDDCGTGTKSVRAFVMLGLDVNGPVNSYCCCFPLYL